MYERNTPIEKTIRLLEYSRNPLASRVLSSGLQGAESAVRERIIRALISRCDSSACEVLASAFLDLNPKERSVLIPKSRQIAKTLPDLLKDADPAKRGAAIEAACHLELLDFIPLILTVAESNSDPLQTFAQDQILAWAKRAGARGTSQTASSPGRTVLLEELYSSLRRFSNHGSKALLDGLIACMRWDDVVASRILRETKSSECATLLDHLRKSKREEAIVLLVEALDLRMLSTELTEILFERVDLEFAVCLGKHVATRMGTNLRSNLSQLKGLPAFQQIKPLDASYPLQVRRGVALAYAASHPRVAELIRMGLEFLQLEDRVGESTAIELLDLVPAFTLEVGAQFAVASLASDDNSLTKQFQALLNLFPSQSLSVQTAIQRIFGPFRLEGLLQRLSRWEETQLQAIASIVKIVDLDWPERIQNELHAPAPKRREGALHGLNYLGVPSNDLWEVVIDAISDENERCRWRAMEVIGKSDHPEAYQKLVELTQDPDPKLSQLAEEELKKKHQMVLPSGSEGVMEHS